jgi:predicted RecA/RadA family phage recombinase
MKNYVQSGAKLLYANVSGETVASGSVVVVGNQIGVALADIPVGGAGAVSMDGVYELPKVPGAVIAQGEAVVYDVSEKAFDDNAMVEAAGDVSGACVAWAEGADGETTIAVKINVGVGTVQA